MNSFFHFDVELLLNTMYFAFSGCKITKIFTLNQIFFEEKHFRSLIFCIFASL